MSAIPLLPIARITSLSRVLGEAGTGGDLDRCLAEMGFRDGSGQSTKWRRIEWVMLDLQHRDNAANRALAFVEAYMDPGRFVGEQARFEALRAQLNQIMAFAGYELGEDGKLRPVPPVKTLTEAQRRVQTLRAKFQNRPIHHEALKYCREELLHENYFHAIFEACKGLAQRIREMSGVQKDGAALVDEVFSIERPLLAFNALQTESEKSEHKGFAMLLKGCFAAIRNPQAHEPKILWQGEDDAADYLTLISLMHRKLDDAVSTGLGGNP